MKRKSCWAVGALILLAAGVAWAIEAGDQAPPLRILPVNTADAEAYDVVARHGEQCVLFFFDVVGSTDESREDATRLLKVAQSIHAEQQGLAATVVFLAPRDERTETAVRRNAEARKVTVPMAVLDPRDQQAAAWHLTGLINVVLIGDGKVIRVFHSYAELRDALIKK